ncbi:MAG: hypothetical protein IJV25_04235 [Prevotella sp.]|nr:hypothetical protein [Prevotella sp.]MBQ9649611.1 hypothetical protein [Prevotella sp.]
MDTRIILLSCLMLAGCASGEFHSILPEDVQLKVGDVVFRRGGGLTSQVVLAADVDGNYSHIGIVVDSANVMMIVHAVPGEPDFKGDVDRVKMDRPECFFSTEYTIVGEVCRPRDSLIARKASEVAMEQYQLGMPFDHDYDDQDTTKMYCTELIAFAFRKAGHDVVDSERHEVHLPFFCARCIFPSDIHSSDFLESIYLFNN